MKPIHLALAASVLVLVVFPARGADSFGRQWMESYYQHPAPDALVQAVGNLNYDGFFADLAQQDVAVGFFSTVFEQNPKKVDSWLRAARFLPLSARRTLAIAAWVAGDPAGTTQVRERFATTRYPIRAEVNRLVAAGPGSVYAAPVASTAAMNLRWGAFLASGDERHIVSILTALGSNEPGLASSARFALARDAAAHPRVLEICQEQLDRQPQAVRAELRAVVDDATAQKPRA
jgi:hypothetical protein